jgi:hypothetical protein
MLEIFTTSDRTAFPVAFADAMERTVGTRNREVIAYKLFVKKLSELTGRDCGASLLDVVNMSNVSALGFVVRAALRLGEYRLEPADLD